MPTRDRTIVVVDDDAGMANALRRMLAAAGFEARVFASAEAMLEARVPAPACMVLDVELPGMSGFDLFDRIAAHGEPPVIFITGYDDDETRAQAERRQARACLLKPFTGRALVREITRALLPRAAHGS